MSKESIKIRLDIDGYENKISGLTTKIRNLKSDSQKRYKSIQDFTVSYLLTEETLRVIEENNREASICEGQIKTLQKKIKYKKEDLLLLDKREKK